MYHFIINPKSRTGNGLKVWHIIEAILKGRAIAYEAHFTHFEHHATALARDICAQPGIKTIVVLGGDGTVNEVINGIDRYQEVILGYIPSGSSNDLARSLGISPDPEKALERILSGKHYQYVDHGILTIPESGHERKFAVSSGMGFDASVTFLALDSNLKYALNKIRLGKLTYPLLAIKELVGYHPSDAVVTVDGREYTFKKVFFMANMIQKCEGGGLIMAPKATGSSRTLTLCVIYNLPKILALLLLPSLFFGKHQMFAGVKLLEGQTIEIKTALPLDVHTDGENAGTYPHIRLTCTKDQIRMLV